jgi:adenylate kinase family enzyme
MINIIFVLGGPGSGKGTLCKNLQQDGWKHVSIGELLREHSKKDPKTNQLLKKGNIVSSMLSVEVLGKYLDTLEDGTKLLVDGFPRNESNWESLKQSNIMYKIHIHCIIFLETTKEIMLSRILKRAETSNEKRSDDSIEIFENRYKLYLENLKILNNPDIKHKLITVDSSCFPENVYENVKQIILMI